MITLGVMARAPLPGHCKTRIARTHGDDFAAALYGAMLKDTLTQLATLPVRHMLLGAPDDGMTTLRDYATPPWTLHPQEGTDLGARMLSAFQRWASPEKPFVICGSDAPLLPVDELAANLTRLHEPRTALIGPSSDGGYCLLGLPRPEPLLFSDMPWSTPRVREITCHRLRALQYNVISLSETFDVDESADVERLAEALSLSPERAPASARFLWGDSPQRLSPRQ
ncbi:MAG: TIGR04282 family arsenosugar biosynthesis glycosyltransferase [Myxococcaceae bacterium]